MKYSNTTIGAVVALVGMAIIAYYVLPEGTAATIFSGLIVVIVLQLLSVRQQEANGHRLMSVENLASDNTQRLDVKDVEKVIDEKVASKVASHLAGTAAPPVVVVTPPTDAK